MLQKLFEQFDISVDPYSFMGLKAQVDVINSEIEDAIRNKIQPEIAMKEISDKYKELQLNSVRLSFHLDYTTKTTTLADYDLLTDKITYYWKELEPLKYDIIQHEVYHYFQMQNYLDAMEDKFPSKSREELKKITLKTLLDYRKGLTNKLDAKYGEGETYKDLYFTTAKEMVNFADTIAKELAKFMKDKKDYILFYKIRSLAVDYANHSAMLSNSNLKAQLYLASPFFEQVDKKLYNLCHKLFKDPFEAGIKYHKVIERLFKYINGQVEKYINGQYTLDTMTEQQLDEKGVGIGLPTNTFGYVWDRVDDLKRYLYAILNNPRTNAAIDQDLQSRGSFTNKKLILPLEKSQTITCPIILVHPNKTRLGRAGSAGLKADFKIFGKRINDHFVIRLTVPYDKDNHPFCGENMLHTLDHEVGHILQALSVVLRYKRIYPTKKVDYNKLINHYFQDVHQDNPAESIENEIAYKTGNAEVGARATTLVRAIELNKYKDEREMICSYLRNPSRSAEDNKYVTLARNIQEVPGFRDYFSLAKKECDTFLIHPLDTKGWEYGYKMIHKYVYPILSAQGDLD